ncbi:E3 ubiquitin-protein ligase TRIM23-like isoform X1 [Daktulosphaira vitifoliae]|uniref:E3 ubiquitin-protein ligase TRIM23-like isoform X1 n=1 Tax=Daktulosphaira vitifoliae TaxID=58002 RepID=UPI0021A99DE3|nr:E3 ubiquitin-protein ligase TRIM23-like isoform X1 [Daktulosphaira vitifoliae]
MSGSNFDYNSMTFVRATPSTDKIDLLECRVCEDIFSLQGEKVPRLLYCGHTICHSCLIRLYQRCSSVQCPFDRQTTPVGSSGVWGLKKNFALLELLERLQKNNKTEININTYMNAETMEKEEQLHVLCDENDNHTAVLYCTVCCTNLCFYCSEQTHSTRTLAKHRRVPLSEKPQERPRCPLHPSHVAEFTCLQDTCHQPSPPLMCFVCKDYGVHKNHKHALVEAEAENIRTMVKNAGPLMRNLMEEINETIQRLDQAMLRLEGGESSNLVENEINNTGTGCMARARVQLYFQHLRETLQVQEAAALSAVDTHIRERLASLRCLQEDLASSLSQVAVICVQCEQAVRQDDTRVLSASVDINHALNVIEKHKQMFTELGQEQIQPDSSIPITFTKDNRVHIGPKMEIRVVTLGLDGAGKTSVLFKLKQNEFMTMIPTLGFNVETVDYKNMKFTIWDVGGQPKLRPLWKHYYLNTQAVVFVIDSSDQPRLLESSNELAKLMTEKELKDAALLILANKQDIPGCVTVETITELFGLYKLCCGRSWHIQSCDAQSGNGLHDGLDWLARQLVASGVHDLN